MPSRERVQMDVHTHITGGSLDRDRSFDRVFAATDETLVLVDIRASRADVVIHVDVGTRRDLAIVTGPWMLGDQRDVALIASMLSVASDALAEGRQLSAMEVIAETIAKRSMLSIIQPVIVPVRASWGIRVHLAEGGNPDAPTDIWIRALKQRDVA